MALHLTHARGARLRTADQSTGEQQRNVAAGSGSQRLTATARRLVCAPMHGRFNNADQMEQSMSRLISWRPFASMLVTVAILALSAPAHAAARRYVSHG